MNNSNQNFEQQIITKALQDEVYKQQLLSKPKATLEQELGQSLPEDIEIEVLKTTKKKAYLVLPLKVD